MKPDKRWTLTCLRDTKGATKLYAQSISDFKTSLVLSCGSTLHSKARVPNTTKYTLRNCF